MPKVHFLNVRNGDCSIIQHGSGRVSVIDVSCARSELLMKAARTFAYNMSESWQPVPGNFDQKSHPDNPVDYLKKLNVTSIFRFIVTHPDMDHLDGITDLFAEFSPANFWDTDNTKEIDDSSFSTRVKMGEDWRFYKALRDGKPESDPKRLVYYSNDVNEFYKSDGLNILAPTPDLMAVANKYKDWNDASYVLLYKTGKRKILFSGDSEDGTWEHILANWAGEVADLDILIAPHHGRHSGRDYRFLDVTRPKLTLFGNASSDHLAYAAWNNRSLPFITNNQAGYIVLDVDSSQLRVFVKNETYARRLTEANHLETYYSADNDGWFLWAFN